MHKDFILGRRILRSRSNETKAFLVREPFDSALILHFQGASTTTLSQTVLTTQKKQSAFFVRLSLFHASIGVRAGSECSKGGGLISPDW